MHCIRWLISLLLCLCLISARESQPLLLNDPSPAKSPEEEWATFRIDPNFEVQLVAAEPLVQDPVALSFDADGRLWVVEMRGFMPDIDGKGEKEPSGRISVLEDEDGDGRMDKSTIYLDSLVMPRSLGLIRGGALVAHSRALWLTQDKDGDLRADTQVLLDSTYARNGLPEHSDNGLLLHTDNWYYNAKSHLRYRLIEGQWRRDSTEFRGQWGLSHDDQGRLFYNYNWSQLHADLVPANSIGRNPNHEPSSGIDHGLSLDRRVYPIRPNPAVNRGYIPGTLDAEGRLLEFTAACSPLVLRSTHFPASYYGNAFVCEPSGNLIKRNVVSSNGALISAYDPNPGTEFMASTDERFRPVNLAQGPDGALYVADMYRGLVQHGAYVTPYLREQTLARKLVLPIHLGRIWRIVPKGWRAPRAEKMSALNAAALVEQLAHRNGWQRDMAQRLLVEKADPTVVPLLEAKAQHDTFTLARFHALWTLEGLGHLNPNLLLALLDDRVDLIKNTALQLLEKTPRLNPTQQTQLEQKILRHSTTANDQTGLQYALSAHLLHPEANLQVNENLINNFVGLPLLRDAVLSSLQGLEFAFLQKLWASPDWLELAPAQEIFLEMLSSAILHHRDAAQVAALLDLLHQGGKALKKREQVVLNALAIAALHFQGRPALTLPRAPALFQRNKITLEASALNNLKRLFSWPGYVPEPLVLAANTLDEKALKQFAQGRQHYLNSCSGCHGTDGKGVSRMGPPMLGSEWVLGDARRLSLIILHGLEGPILVKGKKYEAPNILPVMPAHSTMDDADIAAILTYIRNEWGNQAKPVTTSIVGSTRHTSQGRVMPWTPDDLNKYVDAKWPPEPAPKGSK
jgi:mono/diheme cytochrome c family protein/glucose/arabinose dehydrogenase